MKIDISTGQKFVSIIQSLSQSCIRTKQVPEVYEILKTNLDNIWEDVKILKNNKRIGKKYEKGPFDSYLYYESYTAEILKQNRINIKEIENDLIELSGKDAFSIFSEALYNLNHGACL